MGAAGRQRLFLMPTSPTIGERELSPARHALPMTPSASNLPYRPCVGTMVLNADGLIFIGRRTSGPEQLDALHMWQMPQGGIDSGEDPYHAALRELREETNISSVALLAASRGWFSYDLPPALIGKAWNGRFRGQTQKWYALRFTGRDDEIDILHPAGGHEPEFVEWRWATKSAVAELVVPFKRQVYQAILAEFGQFAAS
jgi:putative (di)nucleoside polyphosphate hydrolase